MRRLLLPVLAVLVTGLLAAPVFADEPTPPTNPPAPAIDNGDTAWMLACTALVMLMTPGLALFYGGIVRRKNLLGTMMHSMVALGIVGVQWVLFGYMLAFGKSQSGLIGWDTSLIGLNGVLSDKPFPGTHIPMFVHCMYQGMFAIITPALISGALAERIRFGPYCLFIFLWSTLVYCPLAHWVWAVDAEGHPAGWLAKLGALDFAGGTVVHIAAGLSGLAAMLVLRKRIGYPEHAMHPNSMVLTLFGAGLLWFGWFGFNGGSGLGSGSLAGSALTATQVAAATAALVWMLIEWAHRGKPTALGVATGLVAGLVAITPASGFVKPVGAIVIGIAVSAICYTIVTLKPRFKYDDSLDAFGVHGVGGFIGAVLTGVLCSAELYQHSGGDISTWALSLPGGNRLSQIGVQFTAACAAIALAFVGSAILVKAIDLLGGFCLRPEDENEGLDAAVHGEVAFDFGLGGELFVDGVSAEPKAASVPPVAANRFTVVLDGSSKGELMTVWSKLCQAGEAPPAPEFTKVYEHVTTVQGNRFRFSGGNPSEVSQSLARLFENQLPGRKLTTRVES